MATLTVKVLVFTLAIAACHASPSSTGIENSECRGKRREGQPCQDGAGICTRVGGPGKRYGLMECVILNATPTQIGLTIYSPGYPGNYYNSESWEHCWTSPEGTVITLTFPWIEVECGGSLPCADQHNCPWDQLKFDDNNDGIYDFPDLCSIHTNFVYVSSSNHVCLEFHTDGSVTYQGFEVVATYL